MTPPFEATDLGPTTRSSYDQRAATTSWLLAQAHAAEVTPGRRSGLLAEVVVVNHRVACAVARRYTQRGVDDDDLEQAACEGLVKAVHRFDPRLGHDFLTFAVPSIRGEVRRHFRDHGWMVRPPRRLQQLRGDLGRATDDLSRELGREPTRDELRSRLGVDEPTLAEVQAVRGCFSPVSLDRPVAAGSGTSLGDTVVAPSQVAETDLRLVLRPLLARLSAREREIVRLRFFEDQTQQEIGAVLGVTQAQVSRLLARILDTLREGLANTPLLEASA